VDPGVHTAHGEIREQRSSPRRRPGGPAETHATHLFGRTSDDPPRLKSPAEFRSYEFDLISDQYDHSNAAVPGVGVVQEKYLNELTAQMAGTAGQYGAEDAGEINTKLRIG
jgi:hypothetical protein